MTGAHKEVVIKINNQAASLKLLDKFHNCVVQREEGAQFVLSQEDHVSSSRMMTVQRHDGKKWAPAVTRQLSSPLRTEKQILGEPTNSRGQILGRTTVTLIKTVSYCYLSNHGTNYPEAPTDRK